MNNNIEVFRKIYGEEPHSISDIIDYKKSYNDFIRGYNEALSHNEDLVKDAERCVCKGNWQTLTNEYESLVNKKFKDKNGDIWKFFGLVDGGDDYYYGMSRNGKFSLLSCVGSLDGWGFKAIEAMKGE